jgi:serine/threonine protein kinase
MFCPSKPNKITIENHVNKLSDQFVITQTKLGNGAFGSVYLAKIDDKFIAVKCEQKEKNNNLTLLKEFKICKKIYTIKKKIHYEINHPPEYKNNLDILELKSPIIIYNYITNNNVLSIPEEFTMEYVLNTNCLPETFSYIECNDFNFLTMELCGDNFEHITEHYKLTENAKYFLAYKLLHIMSCIHRCGIVHRDIKLSNLVLNHKIDSLKTTQIHKLNPVIIDLGLAKEYYKYEGGKVLLISPHNTKNITGTLRYISLNVHEFKSPTIVDDLISLCYSLVVLFTEKNLPWVGHKKDNDKFDPSKHTHENCKCGYHKNKLQNNTKKNNTIAEVKFHTSLEELTDDKYRFLVKWIKYLYSLKSKQMPSYNQLLKILLQENVNLKNLHFDIIK